MKKFILAVLMIVMLAVPCMAEVEPSSLFGIDSSLWGVKTASGGWAAYLGFYGGKIYFNSSGEMPCELYLSSSYNDFIIFSIAQTRYLNGLFFPLLGFGFYQTTATPEVLTIQMNKVYDYWIPDMTCD
ncbi:hypothetical protein ES702_04982 [subsurface metagenome]